MFASTQGLMCTTCSRHAKWVCKPVHYRTSPKMVTESPIICLQYCSPIAGYFTAFKTLALSVGLYDC